MIELILHGGPFMVPLFIASVGVIAVAIERSVHYRRATVDGNTILVELETAIRDGGIDAARDVAEQIPGPAARVWSEGLAHSQLPLPLLRERLDGVASAEITRLERHLPPLEVVAQVAPLIGILGTVWGMVTAFGGVAGGLGQGIGVDGEQLTSGIAMALVTTGAGLAVAIPATVVHHYLRARVDRFIEQLEQTMRDFILTLSTGASPKHAQAARSAPTMRDLTDVRESKKSAAAR